MKRRDWIGGSLAALGALAVPPLRAQGAPFPWTDLRLLDGSVLPATAWHDTAAVLVFWATHCPFCRRHNPHVEKLHRAAAGTRLRVLTFAGDRDPAVVQRYLREHRYTFPVSMDGEPLRQRLGLTRKIPLTLGVDRRGRIGLPIPGEMFEEDVMELLKLAQPSPVSDGVPR